MKPIRLVLVGVVALALTAAAASTSSPAFNREMAPILDAYLDIGHALSQDRLDGVHRAARRIAVEAKKLHPDKARPGHAGHYGSLPKNIRRSALELARAKTLTAARDAFEELGRHIVVWVITAKPAGARVLYCPMVKATWIEKGSGIHNPYLGIAHETCGRVMVGDPSM